MMHRAVQAGYLPEEAKEEEREWEEHETLGDATEDSGEESYHLDTKIPEELDPQGTWNIYIYCIRKTHGLGC